MIISWEKYWSTFMRMLFKLDFAIGHTFLFFVANR